MRTAVFVSGAAIAALVGCSESARPARFAEQASSPPAVRTESPSSTRSVVTVAPEIRRACGISDTDAHFAFDSARVETSDYPVLDKLVTCFTSGPLADREMRLVGHADPRGGEEYNLALGGSRADSVKRFLVQRGLEGAQAATTSRGEMDAVGTNESSWAADRRVDVQLAN
jgi:peptidoglycan-associated lipoprotein